MTRYPCRCRRCGARRTLARQPDHYQRVPRCPCGAAYRVDWYRRGKEHKRTNCTCDGYWYTHRRGSPECYHRELPN